MLPVLCVDVGSTFTKAALVDADSGELLATASHPTTLATDVLEGIDACREELAQAHPSVADADVQTAVQSGLAPADRVDPAERDRESAQRFEVEVVVELAGVVAVQRGAVAARRRLAPSRTRSRRPSGGSAAARS